jgi:hypothetical protein
MKRRGRQDAKDAKPRLLASSLGQSVCDTRTERRADHDGIAFMGLPHVHWASAWGRCVRTIVSDLYQPRKDEHPVRFRLPPQAGTKYARASLSIDLRSRERNVEWLEGTNNRLGRTDNAFMEFFA